MAIDARMWSLFFVSKLHQAAAVSVALTAKLWSALTRVDDRSPVIYQSNIVGLDAKQLGMCGIDFSSSVRFRFQFGFEKNRRFGSVFFADQL